MVSRRVKLVLSALLALGIASASLTPETCAQSALTSEPSAARISKVVENLRKTPADLGIQNEARTIGIQLLSQKRYQEAAELFKVLGETAPANASVLYGVALALFNLRRIEEAEAWVLAAIAKSPKSGYLGKIEPSTSSSFGGATDAFVLLGIILAVKGDNAGALKALYRAVEIAPESFDGQFALGRALYGAGDPVAAAQAFRKSVNLRPKDAQAHFFLCTALERAGDDAAALAAYREFISAAPSAPEGHLGIGILLVKRGASDRDEGIRELQKALDIDDRLYEGHVALGRALIRAGRVSQSIGYLKRAAELAPNNPEPHYQLAIAYRRLGKMEEANAENAIVQQIHQSRRSAQVSPPTRPARPDQ